MSINMSYIISLIGIMVALWMFREGIRTSSTKETTIAYFAGMLIFSAIAMKHLHRLVVNIKLTYPELIYNSVLYKNEILLQTVLFIIVLIYISHVYRKLT